MYASYCLKVGLSIATVAINYDHLAQLYRIKIKIRTKSR